ncbi:MAG: cytochrome P450 [Xanthomonadales bacterium]|jgi:cytochrome P450|nr:cytochrome P450 [Xanthomonadales bacterium]
MTQTPVTPNLPALPPGPSEPHSLDCDEATFDLLPRLVAAYGDVVRVEAPNLKRPAWLLTNPDHIRRVLVNNHRNYVKGVGFERVEMLLGNGIIVSDGAFWRRQRTMIQPGFSRSFMPRYFEMIREVTARLVERWTALAARGEPLDITHATGEYALEVILRAIFSDDLEFFVDQEGINPFVFLTEDPSRNLMVAMKFRQLLKQVQVLIDRRRETGERPFDLLSHMMDATASRSGEHMTDRELIDEVATMIIAGHETSAGTLNWAWYLLARDETSAARVREEVDRVCPRGDLRYEQLDELVFTRQVLEETLRLYPPVWLFTRRAVAEDDIGGFTIEPGDNVFLSPWVTQRLERYWPEPDAFRPDRFAPERVEERVDNAFFPFSSGPRRCIGEFFSFVEMRTHLAMLAPRFRLRHDDSRPVELEPAINLRTRNNLTMTIEILKP